MCFMCYIIKYKGTAPFAYKTLLSLKKHHRNSGGVFLFVQS